jgi:hypothetical protein
MEKRRQPEIIAGIVNADGSINRGDGFTVRKTGTGAYVVDLPSSFRLLSVTMTSYSGGAGVWGTSTIPSATSFSVNVFTPSTGAQIDGAFGFTAVGVQQ